MRLVTLFSTSEPPEGRSDFQDKRTSLECPMNSKSGRVLFKSYGLISNVICSLVDKGHTMTSLKISKRRSYMDNFRASFEGHTHHS